MLGYLRRLVTTGAAYQFGDIVAKGLALLTLPLYTRHVSPEGYGAAESLLTAVILSSIFLRAGVGEAFIRFYFDDEDDRPSRSDRAHRDRHGRLDDDARRRWSRSPFAGQLSWLLLRLHDPELIDCAILGLWAFTNLEMAYAQLRVDERARTYMIASGANVGDDGRFSRCARRVRGPGRARAAARQLRRLGDRRARALVGAAPARLAARQRSRPARDAALRSADGARRRERLRAAGRRSVLPVPRLLAHAPLVCTRSRSSSPPSCSSPCAGFQYAWPPLAYSIDSDEEAARLYSLVTTYYALATGVVVCGVALLGRWMVRLLAAPRVLRRLHRAAVARARLGAVRPLPRVHRDRRSRPGDDAQPPRGRGRASP